MRQALFDWFVEVRSVMKARIPKSVFRAKAKQLYEDYLQEMKEKVPEEEQLKLSDKWIHGWMEEFNVSLRQPNKRFVLPLDVRKKRIFDFLQNVLRVRVWFKKVVGIDIPIVNMDQMPLHRNEISSQKTLTIRDQDTVVKENHHLTRERITCLTVLSSQDGPLPPHFVFKGKGTYLQNKLKRPTGVTTLWSPKGSYRLDTMIKTIKQLPNNTAQDCMPGRTYKKWLLMVLDDYSVHVTNEVRQELLKRGYVLVVMGGGITGDVQINDTHLHQRLKAAYRNRETALMMEQLEMRPDRVPSPSRDEVMDMLSTSLESLDFDVTKALKENFIANALDGSEDIMVRDKIFSLVGEDIIRFRQELLNTPVTRLMRDMLASITPPEGVRIKSLQGEEAPDDEGCELLDGEDGDVEVLSFELEEEPEDEAVQSGAGITGSPHPGCTSQEPKVTGKGDMMLPMNTEDESFNNDATFWNELGNLLGKHSSLVSRNLMPFMLQVNATYTKGRRNLKKRLEAIPCSLPVSSQSSSPEEPVSAMETPNTKTPLTKTTQEPSAKIGDYVLVSHGRHNIPACIVRQAEDGLAVKYYDHVRGNLYSCNEKLTYEILNEDVVKVIPAPDLHQESKSRFFYVFDMDWIFCAYYQCWFLVQ